MVNDYGRAFVRHQPHFCTNGILLGAIEHHSAARDLRTGREYTNYYTGTESTSRGAVLKAQYTEA